MGGPDIVGVESRYVSLDSPDFLDLIDSLSMVPALRRGFE